MEDEWKAKYPALMDTLDMQVLARLVSQLPPNSKIVEIGSRVGGSAKVILDHAHTSTHLYCINEEWKRTADEDPSVYLSMPGVILRFPEILSYDSTYSYAKNLLSDYSNVTLIPGESPKDVQDWNLTVDFIFEDSCHTNPGLHDNIRFWWGKLADNGIMVGHDYINRFPDVIYEANLLADQEGCELHVEGEMWWVVKKSKEI
jgi:hypothetical protein